VEDDGEGSPFTVGIRGMLKRRIPGFVYSGSLQPLVSPMSSSVLVRLVHVRGQSWTKSLLLIVGREYIALLDIQIKRGKEGRKEVVMNVNKQSEGTSRRRELM